MTSVGRDGTVDFWFYRKGARQVQVVGDFANWRGGELTMCDRGDGWWRLSTRLDSGEYRFRYVADGEWYTDYASNGIEVDKMGVNSVLVVPERRADAGSMTPVKMVA